MMTPQHNSTTPRLTTLWALLARAAQQHPEAIAFIENDQQLSYQALLQWSLQLSAGLQTCGLQRGDRVAIWLPNITLWIALQFACARIGVAVVAINTRLKAAELGDLLARSGAQVLVCWPQFKNIDVMGILNEIEPSCLIDLKTIVMHQYASLSPRVLSKQYTNINIIDIEQLLRLGTESNASGEAQDGCVMFTTSGTTSRPKLVLHTQSSIAIHAQDTIETLEYNALDTVIQVVTPLSGVSGHGMPIAAIAAQRTCVLLPTFDAEQSIQLINSYAVTHIHANHEIIRRWASLLSQNQGLSSLRRVNCGSGIAQVRPLAQAHDITLQSIYGSSEMQAKFSRQFPYDDPLHMNDAGGVPISQRAQARCVDFNTGEITPQGEIGELQFQGPSQMLEYFGDKAATQNAFTPDGFIRSGDCGFMRENGGFVFKSRMGDILKISGYMTSPAEIEALIMTTPLITQCQVVGVDTEKGMRTFAFVTSTGPLDEAKLIHHCKQRMASYKVPVRIIVINEFPMTVGANAPKVQKVKLREIAQTIMTTSKINNH